MHLRPLATIIALAIVALAFSWAGERALAQEGRQEPPPGAELVIFNGPAGPYNVKITQSPARPIVGTLRVIVEPVDAETGLPVGNALIRVFGTPPEDGERQFSPALNSPTDRTLYFGQVQLEDAGVWTLDIEIDGPLGRAVAIAQTTINERARSGAGTLVGTILFVLISAGFVGGGTWLWYSSKRARERRNAIRQGGGNPRRSSG